jgi:hypothetical protein
MEARRRRSGQRVSCSMFGSTDAKPCPSNGTTKSRSMSACSSRANGKVSSQKRSGKLRANAGAGARDTPPPPAGRRRADQLGGECATGSRCFHHASSRSSVRDWTNWRAVWDSALQWVSTNGKFIGIFSRGLTALDELSEPVPGLGAGALPARRLTRRAAPRAGDRDRRSVQECVPPGFLRFGCCGGSSLCAAVRRPPRATPRNWLRSVNCRVGGRTDGLNAAQSVCELIIAFHVI